MAPKQKISLIRKTWLFYSFVVFTFVYVTAFAANSIMDDDISTQIEREFAFDPAVPFNTINVRTVRGVATLSGTVNNVLAKDRAERITKTVRGVQSVINLIEVDPLIEMTASQLRQAVNDALLYDSATDSYEIDISVKDDGTVTLTGNVDSFQERKLAETVSKGVNGVTTVVNKINVTPQLTRSDNEIKPEIEKRMKWDNLLDDSLIDVVVENGNVKLTGIVGSAAEKNRAQWDAWVSGVNSVDISGLQVTLWTQDNDLRDSNNVPRSDTAIRDAIRNSLLYDPRVQAFNVNVKVTKGSVILQGIVDNISAKKAAVHDAQNTIGVIDVKDLIKVQPVTKHSDQKISHNVKNALLRNPFTQSFEIDVQVDNGVVYLKGVVDSYFEKAEAENSVYSAEGVTDVKNNLKINYPNIVVYDPYVYDWSIYDYSWYQGKPVIHSKSDWSIVQDIKEEFVWSPFVDANDVAVAVENGVATLSGTVDSWSEYHASRKNAFEGGAVTVINKLVVK